MEQFTSKIKHSFLWHILKKVQQIILIICSIAAVSIIVLAVVMRYIFGTDLYGMEEIIVIVAFWLYFIGGAYGSYEKSHIKADIISVYVKNEKIKVILAVITGAIETIVSAVLTHWGYGYFMWGIEKGAKSPGLKIPLVFSQSVIFFGLFLMTFYFLIYFIDAIIIAKNRLANGNE